MSNTTTNITSRRSGWHLTLAFYRAALAAGFTATAIKEFEARDGVAWSTTLSLGKVKVIEASNGGFGGPDEIDCVYPKKPDPASIQKARDAVKDAQAKLFALPEAGEVIRDFDARVANYGADKEKIKAEIDRIMQEPPRMNDDTLGYLIQELATVRKMVPLFRRKAATKLMWANAGAEFPDHMTLNVPDTPANREKAADRFAAELKDHQGFVMDLIADL